MTDWARETLYFAVLDGDDPRAWRPWRDEDCTYGSLYDEWSSRAPEGDVQVDQPEAKFKPLMDPIKAVLAADPDRLQSIVGVIIDATGDPSDVLFYEDKMVHLEKLCLRIARGANPEGLLIKKVAFEVWFFIEGRNLRQWDHWASRAKNIVFNSMNATPRVEWLPSGAVFPIVADRLESDCEHKLLWGNR